MNVVIFVVRVFFSFSPRSIRKYCGTHARRLIHTIGSKDLQGNLQFLVLKFHLFEYILPLMLRRRQFCNLTSLHEVEQKTQFPAEGHHRRVKGLCVLGRR